MRFKKGDPLNLEGKVMIFGKFNPNNKASVNGFSYDSESNIVAMYASNDETDFREKTGYDGDISQVNSVPGEGFNLPRLLKAAYAASSEQNFIEGDFDVLFVGEFETPALAVEGLFLGSMYYALLLKNQSSRKEVKTQKNVKLLPAPAQKLDFLQTHILYVGTSIRDALLHSYIIPMSDAKRFKRENVYQKLEKELLTFCQGSKFEVSALGLCETVCLSVQTKTPELNHLYLQKVDALIHQMDAVHLEDFKRAAELKRKIQQVEEQIRAHAN